MTINFSIIKNSIREIYTQPPIIFSYTIISTVFILLIFGLKVEYEGDAIIAIQLFRASFNETEVYIFLNGFIKDSSFFFKYLLMFLFIVQSSTFYTDIIENPLLGIILTKPISRTSLFLSKYLAQIISIFLLLSVAGIGISLLLYFKLNHTINLTSIYFSSIFCFEFISLFTFMLLFSFILEKATAITIIGISIYFIFSPLFLMAKGMDIILVNIISYIFPPLWEVNLQCNHLFDGKEIIFNIFVYNLPYIVVYLSVALFHFNQKDIS